MSVDNVKSEIMDYFLDLKYEILKKFCVDEKCNKCAMRTEEKVSYEYDEWEQYCLNGKDINDIEYCFIPLFVSKIKAKFYKEKILEERQKKLEEEYEEFCKYIEEQK